MSENATPARFAQDVPNALLESYPWAGRLAVSDRTGDLLGADEYGCVRNKLRADPTRMEHPNEHPGRALGRCEVLHPAGEM